GTNTTYLSNAVNNYFGCNFKQLLNKYRVEYAKSLLLEGTYSTSSLFRKCGFASQSVFYAAFHKIVGSSPLQFLYKAPSKHRKRFKVLL
ncbi:helix-turn-helix domain-containing protein, partial [Phocaeicola vulgatus]